MTYEQLSLPICQSASVTASAFRARLSVLLELEEASKIHEELYFLRSCGWLKSDTLQFFSEKMLRDYLTTRGGSHSVLFSPQWQNWGIVSNTKCLTARILASRSTVRECSLSDILEDSVDDRYFLSEQTIRRLTGYKDSSFQTL